MSERLAIVMPVFNEEESLAKVFDEWIPVLDKAGVQYSFLAMDDGSKDRTFEIIKSYEQKYPEKVIALQHTNRGHGQSCIRGYKMAVEKGFHYILQIDSDGQCDAQYFESFWNSRSQSPVFGYRSTREDGNNRWWISRVVSLVGFIGTGTWVKDPNVPYRLFKAEQVSDILDSVPTDFHLANILISLKLRQKHPIKWIDICFRDRFGGSPSVKTFSFAQQGLKLLRQLWLS